MKFLIATILVLVVSFSGCANQDKKPAQRVSEVKFFDVETPGNLASTIPVGCVDVSGLTNKMTPADVIQGFSKCMAANDYPRAARLLLFLRIYGSYDQLRVKDKTAHQGLYMLMYKATSSLTVEQNEKGRLAYQHTVEKDLAGNCAALRKLGPPDYYPAYMIQHGVDAIAGQSQEALVVDFNSEAAWNDTLRGRLRCP